MCAVALRRRPRSSLAASVAGARRAPLPDFIEPCDPTLRGDAPPGEDWLYEIKADGYRAQAHLNDGNVVVYSRNGLDWTTQFPGIAQAVARLPARQAIIDGEAVVYGATGLPDFQALRRELGKRGGERLVYHAFDPLYLDGFDLRRVRYVERKRLPQTLLADARQPIVYVEYLDADGEQVFRHACKMGLEGV